MEMTGELPSLTPLGDAAFAPARQADPGGDVLEYVLNRLPAVEMRIVRPRDPLQPARHHILLQRKTGAATYRSLSQPRMCAYRTTSARLPRPSFWPAFALWASIVLTLTSSCDAISLFECPSATRRNTCSSRADSEGLFGDGPVGVGRGRESAATLVEMVPST